MNNDRICVDCGCDYEYDSNSPLGASSLRCSSCRKKNTRFTKKAKLFEIAGSRCLKCGYSGSIDALQLMDASFPLKKPETQEQLEAQAKKQFTICLNCKAELDSKYYQFKVVSIDPVRVEFYLRSVRMILEKIEPKGEMITDSDVEIITGNQGHDARRISHSKKTPELQ